MLPTSLGLLLPAFGPERKGAAIGLWSAVGRRGGRLRPADRRPAGPGQLALGLPGQPALQRCWRSSSGCACCARCATRRPTAPTCSAPPCSRSRWPAWWRPSSRARTGAGTARASWAPSRWPPSRAPGWWPARGATPIPSSSPRSSGTGRWPWPTSARSPSSAASVRWSSVASSSSPASGTSRCCTPASSSPPARCWPG